MSSTRRSLRRGARTRARDQDGGGDVTGGTEGATTRTARAAAGDAAKRKRAAAAQLASDAASADTDKLPPEKDAAAASVSAAGSDASDDEFVDGAKPLRGPGGRAAKRRHEGDRDSGIIPLASVAAQAALVAPEMGDSGDDTVQGDEETEGGDGEVEDVSAQAVEVADGTSHRALGSGNEHVQLGGGAIVSDDDDDDDGDDDGDDEEIDESELVVDTGAVVDRDDGGSRNQAGLAAGGSGGELEMSPITAAYAAAQHAVHTKQPLDVWSARMAQALQVALVQPKDDTETDAFVRGPVTECIRLAHAVRERPYGDAGKVIDKAVYGFFAAVARVLLRRLLCDDDIPEAERTPAHDEWRNRAATNDMLVGQLSKVLSQETPFWQVIGRKKGRIVWDVLISVFNGPEAPGDPEWEARGLNRLVKTVKVTLDLPTRLFAVMELLQHYSAISARDYDATFLNSFLLPLVDRARDTIFGAANELTDEQLRKISNFTELGNSAVTLFKRLSSIGGVNQAALESVHRFRLAFALKALRSPFLDKRISGCVDVGELCKESQPHTYRDPAEVPRWLTPQVMGQWLADNNVVQMILLEQSHEEVMRRAGEIIYFLMEEQLLDEPTMEMIWQSMIGKHETVQLAITGMISEVVAAPGERDAPSDAAHAFVIFLVGKVRGELESVIASKQQQFGAEARVRSCATTESPLSRRKGVGSRSTPWTKPMLQLIDSALENANHNALLADELRPVVYEALWRGFVHIDRAPGSSAHPLLTRLHELYLRAGSGDAPTRFQLQMLLNCVNAVDRRFAVRRVLRLFIDMLDRDKGSWSTKFDPRDDLVREIDVIAVLMKDIMPREGASSARARKVPLRERLSALSKMTVNSGTFVTFEQAVALWNSTEGDADDRALLLRWLSVASRWPCFATETHNVQNAEFDDSKDVFDPDTLAPIFSKLLCRIPVETVTPQGLTCFLNFMLQQNRSLARLELEGPARDGGYELVVNTTDLRGLDRLWDILLHAPAATADEAIDHLGALFVAPSGNDADDARVRHIELVTEIFNRLRPYSHGEAPEEPRGMAVAKRLLQLLTSFLQLLVDESCERPHAQNAMAHTVRIPVIVRPHERVVIPAPAAGTLQNHFGSLQAPQPGAGFASAGSELRPVSGGVRRMTVSMLQHDDVEALRSAVARRLGVTDRARVSVQRNTAAGAPTLALLSEDQYRKGIAAANISEEKGAVITWELEPEPEPVDNEAGGGGGGGGAATTAGDSAHVPAQQLKWGSQAGTEEDGDSQSSRLTPGFDGETPSSDDGGAAVVRPAPQGSVEGKAGGAVAEAADDADDDGDDAATVLSARMRDGASCLVADNHAETLLTLAASSDSDVASRAWGLLLGIPTSANLLERLKSPRAVDWEALLKAPATPSSVYMLQQAVLFLRPPATPDVSLEGCDRPAEWAAAFVASGGAAAVVDCILATKARALGKSLGRRSSEYATPWERKRAGSCLRLLDCIFSGPPPRAAVVVEESPDHLLGEEPQRPDKRCYEWLGSERAEALMRWLWLFTAALTSVTSGDGGAVVDEGDELCADRMSMMLLPDCTAALRGLAASMSEQPEVLQRCVGKDEIRAVTAMLVSNSGDREKATVGSCLEEVLSAAPHVASMTADRCLALAQHKGFTVSLPKPLPFFSLFCRAMEHATNGAERAAEVTASAMRLLRQARRVVRREQRHHLGKPLDRAAETVADSVTGCLQVLRVALLLHAPGKDVTARVIHEVLSEGLLHIGAPVFRSANTRRAGADVIIAVGSDREAFAKVSALVSTFQLRAKESLESAQGRLGRAAFISNELARAPSGYVGLVNQGLTCYMNSLLQQLFALPQLRRDLLTADEPPASVLEGRFGPQLIELRRQLLRTFAHLASSQTKAYNPKDFVEACRNEPNGYFPLDSAVHQQNDAHEFFNLLLDRLGTAFPDPEAIARAKEKGTSSEDASAIGEPDLLQRHMGGRLLHQLKGMHGSCPHTSERPEPFLCVSVDIKGHKTLQDSLAGFVTADLLEGENAYYCERCSKKVDSLKRCCFDAEGLPSTLTLHLKRFDISYETFDKYKINDRLVFPKELDMYPHTLQGIEAAEAADDGTDGAAGGAAAASNPRDVDAVRERCKYMLRGVLVHAGQANYGHYYSFIQTRLPDGRGGEWCKFDDDDVRRFDVAHLGEETFGGPLAARGGRRSRRLLSDKNAFMLFYDRVSPPSGPASPKIARHLSIGSAASSEMGADDSASTPVKRKRRRLTSFDGDEGNASVTPSKLSRLEGDTRRADVSDSGSDAVATSAEAPRAAGTVDRSLVRDDAIAEEVEAANASLWFVRHAYDADVGRLWSALFNALLGAAESGEALPGTQETLALLQAGVSHVAHVALRKLTVPVTDWSRRQHMCAVQAFAHLLGPVEPPCVALPKYDDGVLELDDADAGADAAARGGSPSAAVLSQVSVVACSTFYRELTLNNWVAWEQLLLGAPEEATRHTAAALVRRLVTQLHAQAPGTLTTLTYEVPAASPAASPVASSGGTSVESAPSPAQGDAAAAAEGSPAAPRLTLCSSWSPPTVGPATSPVSMDSDASSRSATPAQGPSVAPAVLGAAPPASGAQAVAPAAASAATAEEEELGDARAQPAAPALPAAAHAASGAGMSEAGSIAFAIDPVALMWRELVTKACTTAFALLSDSWGREKEFLQLLQQLAWVGPEVAHLLVSHGALVSLVRVFVYQRDEWARLHTVLEPYRWSADPKFCSAVGHDATVICAIADLVRALQRLPGPGKPWTLFPRCPLGVGNLPQVWTVVGHESFLESMNLLGHLVDEKTAIHRVLLRGVAVDEEPHRQFMTMLDNLLVRYQRDNGFLDATLLKVVSASMTIGDGLDSERRIDVFERRIAHITDAVEMDSGSWTAVAAHNKMLIAVAEQSAYIMAELLKAWRGDEGLLRWMERSERYQEGIEQLLDYIKTGLARFATAGHFARPDVAQQRFLKKMATETIYELMPPRMREVELARRRAAQDAARVRQERAAAAAGDDAAHVPAIVVAPSAAAAADGEEDDEAERPAVSHVHVEPRMTRGIRMVGDVSGDEEEMDYDGDSTRAATDVSDEV